MSEKHLSQTLPILLTQIRQTLLERCHDRLRDDSDIEIIIEMQPKLTPWLTNILDPRRIRLRVNQIVLLHTEKTSDHDCALVLFLRTLADQYDMRNIIHADLLYLATQLDGLKRGETSILSPATKNSPTVAPAKARSPETAQSNATLAAINLDHQQREQLQRILEDMYSSKDDFEQMVLYKLGENLERVACTGDLQRIFFKLIAHYHTHGETRRLIEALLEDRPNHQALRAFAEQIGMHSIQSSERDS